MDADQPVTSFRGEHEFLSNFYAATVTVEGVTWPTAEHAFQARKNPDPVYRQSVLEADTAGEAKRLGRATALRPDWDAVRRWEMLVIVMLKFRQHPDLAKLLDATGERELIEGNYWRDTYWGVYQGRGKNVLGEILMMVRFLLRS